MAEADNYKYLLLRKAKEASGSSTFKSTADWSIMVKSMSPMMALEVKDTESHDWFDEDGLDSYNASRAFMKAFDVEVEFVCKGTSSECNECFKNLVEYCTTGTTEMLIYSPWLEQGKAGVYYTKSERPEITFMGEYDNSGKPKFVWAWKTTFNVRKPKSEVTTTTVNGSTTLTQTDLNG